MCSSDLMVLPMRVSDEAPLLKFMLKTRVLSQAKAMTSRSGRTLPMSDEVQEIVALDLIYA